MITALYLPVSESIRFSCPSSNGVEAAYQAGIRAVEQDLQYAIGDGNNPLNLLRQVQDFLVGEKCSVSLQEIRQAAEEIVRNNKHD
jgi:hypothetical protein